MSLVYRRALALAVIGSLLSAAAAVADDQTVSVRDFEYAPDSVTVATGDTVTWRWDGASGNHSVTGDPNQAESFDSDPTETPLQVSHPIGDTFVHTFTVPGSFRYFDKVSCQPATSSSSCTSGMTGAVVVVNRPPLASFSAEPNPAQVGEEIRFDGSASSDPDGQVVSYDWDLDGDGAYERSTPATTSSYAAPGVRTVSLRVIDDQGAAAVAGRVLTIEAPPPPPPPPPEPPPPEPLDASILVARRQPLAALERQGVSVLLSCDRACTLAVTVGDAAGTPLGAGAGTLATQGTAIVDVPLPAGVMGRLGSRRSARLVVRALAAGPAGEIKQLQQPVTLTASRLVPTAVVGISDQQPGTFDDPLFRALGIRRARYITPWDSIFSEPETLADWISAARRAGLKPMIAFNHDHGSQCPGSPCHGPSLARYERAFRAFRAAYPDITAISPWNEANHQSQPTGKRPELAARYYNVVRRVCPRCTILAADVLDSPNLKRWIPRFLRHVKGKPPRLWGLHNYSDTNRFRSTGTRMLLKLVPGKVWLTETGGIVRFETRAGVVALPQDEGRAGRAIDYLFKVAAKYRKRIARAYIYHWRINNPRDRFDAGLLSPDGRPRPSYEALRQLLRAR